MICDVLNYYGAGVNGKKIKKDSPPFPKKQQKEKFIFFLHRFPKTAEFLFFLNILSPIFVQTGYLSPLTTSNGALIMHVHVHIECIFFSYQMDHVHSCELAVTVSFGILGSLEARIRAIPRPGM